MERFFHKVCPLRSLKGEGQFIQKEESIKTDLRFKIEAADQSQIVNPKSSILNQSNFQIASGRCKLFILCFCVFLAISASSQDSLNLKYLRSFSISAKFVTADQLNNFYLITPKNEILKLDSLGNEQFRFSNNRLGDITSFDASNPFNLLVFYKDFNVVKILDRTLTESGEFNLFETGIFQTPCVGISADKNLWLYDRDNFQLKKIDKNGKVVIESRQLNLLFDENLNPIILRESENKVYLLDSELGLFVFDVFGRFLNKIQIGEAINFQVFEDNILFLKKDKLTSFSTISFFEKEFLLPQKLKEKGQCFFCQNQFFHLKNEAVDIFKIINK